MNAKIDVTFPVGQPFLRLIGVFALMMAVCHHVAFFQVEANAALAKSLFCSSSAHRYLFHVRNELLQH